MEYRSDVVMVKKKPNTPVLLPLQYSNLKRRAMADFEYVACPKCQEKFMAGEEFFRLPQAYCHCPYCGNEFLVGVAAAEANKAADKRAT